MERNQARHRPASRRTSSWLARLALAPILAVGFASPAAAVPITYELQVFGGWFSGSLGGVPFTNANIALTFDGDTADVVAYSMTGAFGAEIVKGTATVTITQSGSPTMSATFLPAAGIYVSVDGQNSGIGFGSHGALPGDPTFPGEPVYPLAMYTGTGAVAGYDLTTDFSLGGYPVSCVAFATPAQCATPIPLPTTAGDLLVDSQATVGGFFRATTHPVAQGVPITYTLSVYGGNASGSLGSLPFSNGYFDLTFEGNTADVASYSVTGASGAVIQTGTAKVTVYDSNHAVLAQGTFLPSAGIFVSVDASNNGIGFGSHGVPIADPGFPGEPVYPSGLLTPTGAVASYDLRSDFVVSGFATSCVGFATPAACAPPLALPTTAGDLTLDHVNIAFAQFVVQTHAAVTDFATFDARVEIGGRRHGRFELSGRFTLGAASNGIDPVSEPVALQLGGQSVAIPAGSFETTGKGGYRFAGTADGVDLNVRIDPRGDAFRIAAEGRGLDLSGVARPVSVGLTIGNDAGTTTAASRHD